MRLKRISRLMMSCATSSLLIAGCSSAPEPEDAIDVGGVEVEELPSVTAATEAEENEIVTVPRLIAESSSLPGVEELSLERLADGLRAVTFDGSKAYIEKEPNWELARQLKEQAATPLVSPDEVALDETDGSEGIHTKWLFDGAGDPGTTDNRSVPPQSSPFTKIAHLSSGCSGTYIGPRTLITAAHCVVTASGNIRTNITFTPYKVGANAPYGTHTQGGSTTTVPSQYIALEQANAEYTREMMDWDFAVISWAVRPLPMMLVGSTNYTPNGNPDGTVEIFGYPGSGCPGTGANPVLCGHGTPGTYINGPFLETATTDMTGGQSGGPWWRSANRRPIGINIAEWGYYDFWRCGFDMCFRNFARRIDNTVDAFIRNSSPDF